MTRAITGWTIVMIAIAFMGQEFATKLVAFFACCVGIGLMWWGMDSMENGDRL